MADQGLREIAVENYLLRSTKHRKLWRTTIAKVLKRHVKLKKKKNLFQSLTSFLIGFFTILVNIIFFSGNVSIYFNVIFTTMEYETENSVFGTCLSYLRRTSPSTIHFSISYILASIVVRYIIHYFHFVQPTKYLLWIVIDKFYFSYNSFIL